MKVSTKKFSGAFSKILRKSSEIRSCRQYEHLQKRHKEELIPKDVPKGHLVVYVGEEHKRFIVHVCFLQHPLFQNLLDQAQQEYGFIPNSRLCIPCDEHIFDSILHHIGSQEHRGFCPCF